MVWACILEGAAKFHLEVSENKDAIFLSFKFTDTLNPVHWNANKAFSQNDCLMVGS